MCPAAFVLLCMTRNISLFVYLLYCCHHCQITGILEVRVWVRVTSSWFVFLPLNAVSKNTPASPVSHNCSKIRLCWNYCLYNKAKESNWDDFFYPPAIYQSYDGFKLVRTDFVITIYGKECMLHGLWAARCLICTGRSNFWVVFFSQLNHVHAHKTHSSALLLPHIKTKNLKNTSQIYPETKSCADYNCSLYQNLITTQKESR